MDLRQLIQLKRKGLSNRKVAQALGVSRNTVPDDVVNELMAQIIRFSRMYWKSVNPQPLPVTIAYSDLLARQVCWFSNKEVPSAVRRVPFFL